MDRQWSKQEAYVYVFSVLCLLLSRLFICALWSLAGKRLTSWLLFVVSYCEFVTFPLVSWVRRGTWLYQYLIFAPLLTLLCRCDSGVAHRHSQHQARHWERLLTSRGLPSDSTCVLKAESGKLDIKRRESGILFISLPIVSLFKLVIMT